MPLYKGLTKIPKKLKLLIAYITRKIAISTFFLSLIIIGCVWLTQSLRFMEIIVNKNVSLLDFFSLVGLLIPDIISLVLPLCLTFSVLFVYHRLINDHEMVVMRTSGASDWFLARPAFLVSFMAVVIHLIINIGILPHSFSTFRDKEFSLRHELSALLIQQSQFTSIKGVTVFIQKSKGGRLEGVFIHDQRKKEDVVSQTITAQKGEIYYQKGLYQLMLQKGSRFQEKQDSSPTLLEFETLLYDLTSFSSPKEQRNIKTYEKHLGELLNPSESLTDFEKSRQKAEAHQRLLIPFLSIIASLLSVFLMLKCLTPRRQSFKPVWLTLLAVLGLYIILYVLLNSSHVFFLAFETAYGLVFGLLFLLIVLLKTPAKIKCTRREGL